MLKKIAAFDWDNTLTPHFDSIIRELTKLMIEGLTAESLSKLSSRYGLRITSQAAESHVQALSMNFTNTNILAYLREYNDQGFLFRDKTLALFEELSESGIPIGILTCNQFPSIILEFLATSGLSQRALGNVTLITMEYNYSLAHGHKKAHMGILLKLLNTELEYTPLHVFSEKILEDHKHYIHLPAQGNLKIFGYKDINPAQLKYDPSCILFVDDSEENIRYAKLFGAKVKLASPKTSEHLAFIEREILDPIRSYKSGISSTLSLRKSMPKKITYTGEPVDTTPVSSCDNSFSFPDSAQNLGFSFVGSTSGTNVFGFGAPSTLVVPASSTSLATSSDLSLSGSSNGSGLTHSEEIAREIAETLERNTLKSSNELQRSR